MKNMSKTNKRFNLLVCAVIALVMALSCLSFAVAPKTVKAEEPKIDDIRIVDISDGQFNDDSSSILTSSSSWTGSYVGNFPGNVIAGVVDLEVSASDNEKFMEETKLDKYPEYKTSKPLSPYGKEKYFGGENSKVLMINTNGMATAYGYKSNEVELAANSFYMFSVWVKTGDFTQNRGAVIKLSGFDYDIGFWNINTYRENGAVVDAAKDDTNGFRQYRIYVATAQNSVSATVNLQVGDSYVYKADGEDDYITHVTPSNGYAFFDNVTCEQLSPNVYYTRTHVVNTDNTLVHDFNETSAIIGESKVIGSFENGYNAEGWSIITEGDNVSTGGYRYIGTYNAGRRFDEESDFAFESNPYTPKGNSDYIGDRNILVMQALDNDASIGLESQEIEIERNSFYRISAWVNTQKFDSDSNAAMVIVGENNIAADEYKLSPVVINHITGSGEANVRYGWSKYSFYVRGSIAKNCNVKLQLWLGFSDKCKGIVLFDDVRVEKLTYTYFNNNMSNGTLVTFDKEPSTTVDNGRFFNAENYGDEFPLKPVQWTSFGDVADSDVSGIILTDDEHYNANYNRYLNVINPVKANHQEYNPVKYPSMLLLASKEDAYFGYNSTGITISTNNNYKISVTMYTVNMQGSGANLWISVSGNTIAAIKNIKDSNRLFTTYDFYLQGDKPFESGTGIDYTATLSIALGNANQKASGSIYVAEVKLVSLEDEEFTAKYDEYKNSTSTDLPFAVYSFSELGFFNYDKSDKNAIKATSSWNIKDSAIDAEGKYTLGVFDPNGIDNNNGAYIPAEIINAYKSPAFINKFDRVFTLQARGTNVSAQLTNPLKLDANSYYTVTVSMAVVIPSDLNTDKSVGAGIYLNGSPYGDVTFSNIQTTSELLNKYEFRDFMFYIETNASDTNVYLNVSLGDTDPNTYVYGELYVAYVGITKLASSDEAIEESDTVKIINKHVDVSENPEDEDDHDHENETEVNPANDSERWWLIPSILFGIAIVLAIVGSIIRLIVDKASRRQRTKQLNSYDRRMGYAVPEDESEAFDDDSNNIEPAATKVVEQDIEAFNDDDADVPTKEVKEEQPKAEEPKENKAAQSDDVNNDFDE